MGKGGPGWCLGSLHGDDVRAGPLQALLLAEAQLPQHNVQESVKAATAMHTSKGHSAALRGPSLPEHSRVRGEAGEDLSRVAV